MTEEQEKIHKLAEIYSELDKNKNGFEFGKDFSPDLFPCVENSMEFLESVKVNPPKPKLRLIDMSVCIGSQIDCYFSAMQFSTIGNLTDIAHDNTYKCTSNAHKYWTCCEVRENHPHAWNGGKCPIPEGLMINVVFRNGQLANIVDYCGERWVHLKRELDIIQFTVTGIKEGYKYDKNDIKC